MPSRSHPGGFTLIELLVTLSVVAILATIAVPSFTSFFTSNRAQTQVSSLVRDLNYARAEAVRRGQNVSVTAVSGDDWHTGWNIRAGATDLRQQSALAGDATLAAGNLATLTFDRAGRVPAATTFRYCLPDGPDNLEREISVTMIGHISVDRTPCP